MWVIYDIVRCSLVTINADDNSEIAIKLESQWPMVAESGNFVQTTLIYQNFPELESATPCVRGART